MKKILFATLLLITTHSFCGEFFGIAAGQALLGAGPVALSNHLLAEKGTPLLSINNTLSSKVALGILATAGAAVFIKDIRDSYDDTKREITSMPLTDTQQAVYQFLITSISLGTGYFVLSVFNENISLPISALCCLTGYAIIRGTEETYFCFTPRPRGLRKRKELPVT